MVVAIIKASIAAIIFLIFFGVLSLRKPEVVGADFYWSKHKWFYIPKYKKATNKYYQHQIKVIGMASIIAAIILLAFIITSAIYPPILLFFQSS